MTFEDPAADVLAHAAETFGLLASPARLHIVWALAQGESDVTGLAERVGGALPAVSQHLTKLKLAGLVRSRREGRRQIYFVDAPDVVDVVRLTLHRLADRTDRADRAVGADGAVGPDAAVGADRVAGALRPAVRLRGL